MGGLPSPSEILSTIDAFRLTSPGDTIEVAFYGGTFTSLLRKEQGALLAPLQPFIHAGGIESVRVSTRPDAIDDETVVFLRNHGVRTVELGAQSMDDAVLEQSGRGHTADDVRSAAAVLRRAGMTVGIQLMPGLPCSSPRNDLSSLSEALKLAPDFLRIYPTVVLSGTDLEQLYLKGSYRPLSLDEAVKLCGAMLHRSMRAKIPVIRMGLQATDPLSEAGNIVAGPYHPAFRQLVESEICLSLLQGLAAGIQRNASAVVRCAPSRVSDVIGQRRTNLERLFAATGVTIERVESDKRLSPMDFILVTENGEFQGNLLFEYEYTYEGE